MSGKVEARLASLGITLPTAPNPVANYVPSFLAGNLLFISGQISKAGDGRLLAGRVGADLDVANGREAARFCALNILSQAKAAIGDLDRIVQIAKLTGYILETTGSYVPVFIIAGVAYLIALAIVHLLAPTLEKAKI